MKSNFNTCLTRVLRDEGGYTNDPADSGGATNFGITIADYRKYIKQDGTSEDVRNMTVDQAAQIYRTRYWNALNCDALSSGVDYTVFDYGVNSGLGRPQKALQTFKSLKGDKLIDAINDERMAFLKALAVRRPKDKKFLGGWTSRVNRVRAFSHILAGKKDVVTGPVAGGTATIGVWATLNQYITTHPYVTVGIAIAIGLAIWGIAHYIRNRK